MRCRDAAIAADAIDAILRQMSLPLAITLLRADIALLLFAAITLIFSLLRFICHD